MFYSPQTGGFYHPAVHTEMPEDAISISEARYAELMEARSRGDQIGLDGDQLIILPAPPPSSEDMLASLRHQRDALLDASDWTQMPDAPLDEVQREAWRVYRQQLRDLPETITDPADIDWPVSPTGADA